MLPITTLVFPSCPDLLLEEISREGQTFFLTVRSSKKGMACPDCGNISKKVHSHFPRTLADVSLMDYEVRLRVHVRCFFYANAEYARITFAEPLADLAVPHARRTNRQANRLRAMAKELGGRPAAHESENVLMHAADPAASAPPCSASCCPNPVYAWSRRLVYAQRANVRHDPG